MKGAPLFLNCPLCARVASSKASFILDLSDAEIWPKSRDKCLHRDLINILVSASMAAGAILRRPLSSSLTISRKPFGGPGGLLGRISLSNNVQASNHGRVQSVSWGCLIMANELEEREEEKEEEEEEGEGIYASERKCNAGGCMNGAATDRKPDTRTTTNRRSMISACPAQ